MKSVWIINGAIDFEDLKKEKSMSEREVRIHEEWLLSHPGCRSSQEIITQQKAKIAEMDALLSTEPPVPELPPGQPLIKVSGVLEEIETQFVRGYFSNREYAPEEFARKEENRQWGGVLLAAIGQSAAAGVISQNGVRPVRNYHFVRGKVNGVSFYGWIGLTPVKAGDYIELAAINKQDHYEVYALTIPALRVISIIPYCNQGIRSRAISEVKGCFVFATIVVLLYLIVSLFSNGLTLNALHFFGAMCCFMYGVHAVIAPFLYFHCKEKPAPSIVLAQEIFSILGMTDPTNVHLEKITKNRIKQSNDHDINDREVPQSNGSTDYYYFY